MVERQMLTYINACFLGIQIVGKWGAGENREKLYPFNLQ